MGENSEYERISSMIFLWNYFSRISVQNLPHHTLHLVPLVFPLGISGSIYSIDIHHVAKDYSQGPISIFLEVNKSTYLNLSWKGMSSAPTFIVCLWPSTQFIAICQCFYCTKKYQIRHSTQDSLRSTEYRGKNTSSFCL